LAPLRIRAVFEAWWPLAASWLLMGFELPLVSAMMARMADPTLSLAAYGGVVFPVALLIESPIVMLLTASTALSRDAQAYRLMRDFMLATAGSLTVLHVLIAFTPLYDVVAGGILGVPEAVREPGRWGLMIMTPWTFSIAYRRFQQGVLIRFGRSRLVGLGTVVRLAAIVLVLAVCWAMGSVPGIVAGTAAVAAGVVSEAVFSAIAVRPVLRHELPETSGAAPLTMTAFLRFYLPLAVTPILLFLGMPFASGAMSRMPRPIESLAVWPVFNGLVFTLRSTTFALSEVAVALLERPRAITALNQFTRMLAVILTVVLVGFAVTPLGTVWFAQVSALAPELAAIGTIALWLGLFQPAFGAYLSLYQGVIVHSRRTRAVTESMVAYLAVASAVMAAGVALGRWTGLHVAVVAFTLGGAAHVGWLRWRARQALRDVLAADAQAEIGASSALATGR
jgi:hypothetical protein